MKILLKKILMLIIFFIVGLILLLIVWKGGGDKISDKIGLLIAGFLGVGFSVFTGIKMLSSFVKGRKDFMSNLKKEEQKNKENKVLSFIDESVQKERRIFLFIIKNPLVWGLYLCSFLLIILFFFFEFYLNKFLVMNFILSLFDFSLKDDQYFFVSSFFFCYSFIVLSILVIPYLILGEIYQKRIKRTSSNILFQVIVDFIYAIPYLVIWSFLWMFLFVSTKSERKRSVFDSFKSMSVSIMISAFSYWIYYSLAKIAYDDKRELFPENGPISFYKKKSKGILAIWVRSGFYFGVPFIVFILIFLINIALASLSVFSEETTQRLFEYSTFYIGIPSLIILALGTIVCSQLNILNYFIKEREKKSSNFVLDLKKD